MKCALSILFSFCACLMIPARAVSPEFMSAYEQLLGDMSSGFPSEEFGSHDKFIVAGFHNLLKLGTREELGEAIAATLGDLNKRPHWFDAYSLSAMLGPRFDRSKIVAAIRDNLDNYFVLDEVENVGHNRRVAINIASTELCYYGTETDADLVRSFAAKVARVNPGLAESLEMTVSDRVKVRELRTKAASLDSPSILERRPQEKLSPLTTDVPPPAPKTPLQSKAPTAPMQETGLTPWRLIIGMLILAVGGLFWLLRKRGL